MRLFYLSALDELDREKCGILGKIRGQIRAFEKSGIEVSFGHFRGLNRFIIEKQEFSVHVSGRTVRDRLGSIYGELTHYILSQGIKTVYIRFTSLDRRAIAFYSGLRDRGIKVIIEFYSHDLELEARKTAKRNMADRRYYAGIKGYVSLLINKHYFPRLRKCVDLIVTTTQAGDLYGVPTINVVNGTDTDTFKARKKVKNGYDFNIISVAMISPWHGYDRALRGMSEYYRGGGEVNILYSVIGEGVEKNNLERLTKRLKLQDHVVFTGIKLNDELDRYYDAADVALEMLAGFRRTRGQISSIKMAEYFSKGIPVVYAADEKLYSGSMGDYCHWVKNDDSPVDIAGIINFCGSLHKTNHHVEEDMHRIASEKFDWSFTMKDLIEFILKA